MAVISQTVCIIHCTVINLHLEAITIQTVTNITRTVVYKSLSSFRSPTAGTLHCGVSDLRWAQGRSCSRVPLQLLGLKSGVIQTSTMNGCSSVMLELTGKGLDASEAGTLEISTHLHSSVSTARAGQCGDSSTSAAWAALGSEREAQLSADVFMRRNTLGKKKKKKTLKNANLFCCIQYVLVSCLKGPSGLKTCSTCVSFYVVMLEVLNIPCCKNKSWIILGFFFICLLVDIPLTLVHPHLLDSSMKGFSHKDGPAGQRTENRKIKKWTYFSYLSNNFLYNCPSWAPPALSWCRKTILSIFLKKVAKSQSKERN